MFSPPAQSPCAGAAPWAGELERGRSTAGTARTGLAGDTHLLAEGNKRELTSEPTVSSEFVFLRMLLILDLKILLYKEPALQRVRDLGTPGTNPYPELHMILKKI